MPNRRTFLKDVAGAAGLVFVGCGVADAGQGRAAGIPSATPRRPVMLKGRRITTVDMHAHCAVPKATELLRRPAANQGTDDPLMLGGQALAQRLAVMDAQRIDISVLSINPNWYDVGRDVVTEVITVQNESLAAFCASHSDRFAAFASVALQFPDLAAQQLEHGMKTLGLRGVAIGGSVAGRELADPAFHPFWAKAEALGAVVFIHPQPAATPDLGNRLKGNGLLTNVIGNPLETTIALSHLIFEGTLDQFPGLKICAAHGGGYLPSYMNRSDHGCVTFPTQCKGGVPKEHPTTYVKRMYYDSLVFTPEALRHLIAEVGADRIVMGTDYPYPWVEAPVDHVLATPGLGDAAQQAILGQTALRLLGLPSR
jgi:aminocarboxymuconate-semialdehyde decarboxylase